MTQLRNRETGQLRDSNEVEREIRATTSCGPTINFDAWGYDIVFPTPAPSFDPLTQRVQMVGAVLAPNGQYQQSWEVVALTTEELAVAAAAETARLAQQTQAEIDAIHEQMSNTITMAAFNGIPSAEAALADSYAQLASLKIKQETGSLPAWSPALTTARVKRARAGVLDALNGMRGDYLAAGDTVNANACTVARQAMRDLPQNAAVLSATNETELRAAYLSAYQAIVAATPVAIQVAYADFRV